MNLTIDEVKRIVGNLYLENQALAAQVAELTAEIEALKAPQGEGATT